MRFVLFGCIRGCSLVYETRCERAELVQKFVPRSRVGIFRNKRTQSTLLDPYLLFRGFFILFGCIWDSLLLYNTQFRNGANLCKSSCHEVASEFFATNAPDPPHWTLNSCFGVYCTIWMHSVLFVCLTKLDPKRAEVVQKFVP